MKMPSLRKEIEQKLAPPAAPGLPEYRSTLENERLWVQYKDLRDLILGKCLEYRAAGQKVPEAFYFFEGSRHEPFRRYGKPPYLMPKRQNKWLRMAVDRLTRFVENPDVYTTCR